MAAAIAAGKKVTLSSDVVLCVEQAAIVQEGDFKTLASVAEAIAAKKNMKADGTAQAAPDNAGCKGVAVRVKFSIRT